MSARANPVHWFEIPVTDLTRARRFYEKVFDTALDPLEMGGIKMAWFPRPPNVAGSSGGLIEDSESNLVALYADS